MNKTLLETGLVSIEEEIKVVRAQILTFKKPGKKKRRFSSLEGAWKGKSNFSLEEIKEAEIKFKGKDKLPGEDFPYTKLS